jgi:hypothetical protein
MTTLSIIITACLLADLIYIWHVEWSDKNR